MRLCDVKDCNRKHRSSGYCKRHYSQHWLYGRVLEHTVNDSRPAIIEGNIAKIPLGVDAKNGYAIIDKEDAWVDKYRWNVNSHGYIQTRMDSSTVSLHRLITNAPEDLEVDHKNHKVNDNRKSNLRLVTRSQNQRNTKVKSNSMTGIKGVRREKNGKYQARILVDGKRIGLGTYKTLEEAGRAYAKAAKEYFGDYAYTTRTAVT